MPIRSIEVICIPCDKCERAKRTIMDVIKGIEIQKKTKIVYDFRHNPSLQGLDKYSINASQAPAILINGTLEFAGRVDAGALRAKLLAFQNT